MMMVPHWVQLWRRQQGSTVMKIQQVGIEFLKSVLSIAPTFLNNKICFLIVKICWANVLARNYICSHQIIFYLCSSNLMLWLTDESGSDSDGAESTSSSYSSLSDYVVVIWGSVWLTNESGSDSNGAEGTSSSYSSLNDYVVIIWCFDWQMRVVVTVMGQRAQAPPTPLLVTM